MGLLGAQGSHHVEPLGQHARIGHRADLAPREFVENVPVEHEPLAHKAEALRHLLLVLPDVDPHGVDLGRRELTGSLHEGGEPRLVPNRGDGDVRAEHAIPQRAVLVEAKVVRLADDEDGGVVDPRPDVGRWLAVDLGVAQDIGDHQRHAGLVRLLQAHVDAAIPHHSAEVALELLAAGVVSARDVLGVVLAHARLVEALRRRHLVAGVAVRRAVLAEDDAAAHAPVCLDQRHLTGHQVGRLRRGDCVGVDERIGDGEIGDDAAGNLLQLSGLQFGVEMLGRLETCSGEGADIGLEVLPLQIAQHLVEQQVIDVIDRVGGDEHRDLPVARVLVELEELQPFGRRDDEAVLRQERALGVAPSESVRVAQRRHIHRQGVPLVRCRQDDGDLGVGGEAWPAYIGRRRGRDGGRRGCGRR